MSERFLERVQTHLSWRLDPVARRRTALHRRRPDTVTLGGVQLVLGGWATDTIRAAIYDEEYERRERTILEATLRSDDIVMELGTGVGYITSVAAGIAQEVRSFDANPALLELAQATLARNGRAARIEAAVLLPDPVEPSVPFYVHDDFWSSSLEPLPGTKRIDVPARDFATSLSGITYLVMDIEGGEVSLLSSPLADVSAICVECHPGSSPPGAINGMLTALFAQGFSIDFALSLPPVLFLSRGR